MPDLTEADFRDTAAGRRELEQLTADIDAAIDDRDYRRAEHLADIQHELLHGGWMLRTSEPGPLGIVCIR